MKMDTTLKYKTLFSTLFKWMFWGALIGSVIGSFTAFLIKTNDYLGHIREQNFWLIYLLPVGGIVIGYLYMRYGKESGNDSAKGNNLVIEGVQREEREEASQKP